MHSSEDGYDYTDTPITVYRQSLSEILDLIYLFRKRNGKCYLTVLDKAVKKADNYYIDLVEDEDDDWMVNLENAEVLINKDIRNGNLFGNATVDDMVKWFEDSGERKYL